MRGPESKQSGCLQILGNDLLICFDNFGFVLVCLRGQRGRRVPVKGVGKATGESGTTVGADQLLSLMKRYGFRNTG